MIGFMNMNETVSQGRIWGLFSIGGLNAGCPENDKRDEMHKRARYWEHDTALGFQQYGKR